MRQALVFCCSLTLAVGAVAVVSADAPSLRTQLLSAPIDARLGGGNSVAVATDQAYDTERPNASAVEERQFGSGRRLFDVSWTEGPPGQQNFGGLGPTFNRDACVSCHVRAGRGQPPENTGFAMDSMLVRLSLPDGSLNPAYGTQLQERAARGVPAEGRTVITYDTIAGTYGDGTPYALLHPHVSFADLAFGPLDGALVSARVAPAMVGLGLLDAVPAATLQALADPDDRDGDGISGRVNMVPDPFGTLVPGKFGWKASVSTLREQAVSASIGDLGLTSSARPSNNCPPVQTACAAFDQGRGLELSDSQIQLMLLYLGTLGVPEARGLDQPKVVRGQALFGSFGCSSCHIPTLVTADSPWPSVAHQTIHPFTDLLLHDMGPGLADNRPDAAATGSEWRTAPLWGLGLLDTVNAHTRLLHDGRARNFAEAILWHGGEAMRAKEDFRKAPAADRAALVAFLDAL